MPFVIEWPEDDRYPRRWWHRVAGWMLSQKYAARFPDRSSADAARKQALLDPMSTRIVEEAVYAHIQSARAHGMTSINTLDIADALNLPSKRVESAIRALRNRGVKVKR